ncbi:MAG TPA: SPOR domain-containing protein [Arenimonas sp.]|nr:SPOR domain-containing protein [Arenimonas sp.]
MKLRGVMLLLACLNIGAGLWWWLQPAPKPQPLTQAEGVPPLALLAEVPELPPLPAVAEHSGSCLSLGPFTDVEAMREAMARLTPAVARIQMRELPGSQLLGYRVFLPPAADREAAMETARQLVARGIRDYYLVSAGEQRHAISLGMFRDLGNAERRREELRAAGFAPQLEPRSEDGLQWWIDFESEADFDWRALLPGADGMEAQPRPCQPADPA